MQAAHILRRPALLPGVAHVLVIVAHDDAALLQLFIGRYLERTAEGNQIFFREPVYVVIVAAVGHRHAQVFYPVPVDLPVPYLEVNEGYMIMADPRPGLADDLTG
jgi:hypothetical protein